MFCPPYDDHYTRSKSAVGLILKEELVVTKTSDTRKTEINAFLHAFDTTLASIKRLYLSASQIQLALHRRHHIAPSP